MIRRAYSRFWAALLCILLIVPPLPPRAYAPPPTGNESPAPAPQGDQPIPVPGPHNNLPQDDMVVEAAPADIAEAVDGLGEPDVPATLPSDWLTGRERILREALELRRQILARADELQRDSSGQEFAAAIEKDQIVVENAIGTARLTHIDGSRVVRVVHAGSQLALIFVDSTRVARTSSHLRQFIARQHIDAGTTRTDRRRGRDLVVAWVNGDEIVSTDFSPKPRFLSRAWWADYWKATWKKPTKGDVVLGVLCGVTQAGLSLCVSGAKVMLDAEATFSTAPAMLAFFFSLFIGSFISTYKNWSYRGGKVSQTLKTSLVGLSFNYSLTFLTGHGASTLSILDTAGVLMHTHLIANVLANEFAKVEWQQPVRLRTMNRDNAGNISYAGVDLNRSSVENQAIYLIPFTLRLGDLTQVTAYIPGLGVVPLGKLLLWGSIPLAQFLGLKYAERRGYPQAAEMRARWERTLRLPISLPVTAFNFVVDKVAAGFRGIRRLAGYLFPGCAQRVDALQEEPVPPPPGPLAPGEMEMPGVPPPQDRVADGR